MDNRRLDYRFHFPITQRKRVDCESPAGAFAAEMVDLSIAGVGLRLDGPASLPRGVRLLLRLPLEGESALSLHADVVHEGAGPAAHHGLRFVPLDDAADNGEREKRLWRYLLDEQRRKRRQGLES